MNTKLLGMQCKTKHIKSFLSALTESINFVKKEIPFVSTVNLVDGQNALTNFQTEI